MIMTTWFTPCSWPPEGGTTGNSWWGCAAQFSESWPYFRPKNLIFHTRFQTRSLKSILIFGPGLIKPVPGSRIVKDTPQFSPPFIFVFSFSQFSGPNYLGAWNGLGLIRQKLCHLTKLERKQKKFSEYILNSHISISFLFIWNWNDKYVHSCTLPYFPRKPYPIPHQNGQSVFRPKRPKTPTLWAVHTYMAYIREYPTGPDPFHDC